MSLQGHRGRERALLVAELAPNSVDAALSGMLANATALVRVANERRD
jgi:hypothetical protein